MDNSTPSKEGQNQGRLAIAFVMPLLLFLILTAVEPREREVPEFVDNPNAPYETELITSESGRRLNTIAAQDEDIRIHGFHYLTIYSIKILLVSTCLLIFLRDYFRNIRWRISLVGVWVGLAGGLIWIALCWLNLESSLFKGIGVPESWLTARSGIDPQSHIAVGWLIWFYVVRFAGLVLVVPVAEELFLRGFLLRYFHDPNWTVVTFVQLGSRAIAISAIYGMVTHPGELIAAAVWFSLISIMMIRTGRFWDCVLAHAVTNAMLGAYILATGSWHLW